MAYSDKVIDHYTNPRNVGSFAKGEDNVGTGVVGAQQAAAARRSPHLSSQEARASVRCR